nr:hypothetical protein [Tanacetum cinerariifolium]
MISYKLHVENYSQMAEDLIRKIYNIANTLRRSIKFKGGLLGIKCTRHSHCQGKDGTSKDVELHLYRSMIGSLIYLTASRPDIMFAVCACARHQVTPKECHMHAVKRMFRYLKGHPKLGLLAFCDYHNMIAILEKSEHNVDFHQIVDFIEASHIRIETTNEGTKILATVDGKPRTISESLIRRNLKLNDEEGISTLLDLKLFENLTLMGYNILPNQKYNFQKGHDRENIIKTSALPHDSTPRVTSLDADEGKISNLKAKIKLLEDKDKGTAELSGDDALIKGMSLETGEEAGVERSTEQESNDTKEMVNVLTSMDAANILTSGVADMAREMKEQMAREDQRMDEQIARDAEIARIHAEEELQMLIDGLDRNNEVIVKHLQEEKFIPVWKQIEDFVPMASKKEGERVKRKWLKLEQGSAKKIKTSEDVSKEDLKEMMQLVPVEEVYVEALQKMPPKKRTTITTTTTTLMTDAQLKVLIAQGVANALAEYDAERSMNGDDSHDSRSGVRRMFPKELNKIKKYVGELPDMIHGSVMSSKPKTMHDMKRGNKVVKKEHIVVLRGYIYFVKFIINPEEDDVKPGVFFRRSFLHMTKAITDFRAGTVIIYPEFDPFLEDIKEEEKSLDDWDHLLDFNLDDVPLSGGEELLTFVCKMGESIRNKKRAMENLNLLYQDIRTSSSAGGHLTQEEVAKEALAIRIGQKFA